MDQYETANVHGWSLYLKWTTPNPTNCKVGEFYDRENNLGYVGYLMEAGKHKIPVIEDWAQKTRVEGEAGKYQYDKATMLYENPFNGWIH